MDDHYSGNLSCNGSIRQEPRRREQQTGRNGLALWEGSAMETILSEQIQAAIDALALAQTQAALVTLAMRKQRVYFGLEYSHMDDSMADIISKLRYLKRLVERREQAEAQMPSVDTTERDETSD